MSTLFARQLIYTNVEARESPKGLGGFQVLLSSAGIAEVDELEVPERLFYREIKDNEELPVKHVFYQTRSGELLLARMVSLPERDGAARHGRYLAHALMFSAADFALVDNDPFFVFKRFAFVETVEAALEMSDRKTSEIPLAQIGLGDATDATDAREARIARAQLLDGLQFEPRRQLLLLAAKRALDEEARNSLGMFAEPDIVFNCLSSIVAAMPSFLRARCSFDTFFRGGNSNSTSYWAMGLPTDVARSSRLFCFDVVAGRFEHPVSAEPQTLFEQWLGEEKRAAAETALSGDTAWEYARWFDSPTSPTPKPRHQEEVKVWDSLSRLRPNALQNQLRRQLERQVGENLAHLLALELKQAQGEVVLEQEFPIQQLADWTWNLCLRQGLSLDLATWNDIARVGDSSGRVVLKLAFLRASRQWERLAQALQLACDGDFQDFALWALAPLSPRVTWSVQRDGSNLQFGPRLKFDAAGDETDSLQLFCALLGQLPTPPEPEKSLRDRLPFMGRRDDSTSQPSNGNASVNTRRWLWLIQKIERDASAYSSGFLAGDNRLPQPRSEQSRR